MLLSHDPETNIELFTFLNVLIVSLCDVSLTSMLFVFTSYIATFPSFVPHRTFPSLISIIEKIPIPSSFFIT